MSERGETLGDLGELALIERIAARARRTLGARADIRIGIGDDAAVLDAPRAGALLVTTDAYVEGIHFRRDFSSDREIGWKAAAGALSDIAAMGGRARHLFLALGAPSETPLGAIDAIVDGLLELSTQHGVALAGGDTVASPDCIFLGLTVLGEPAGAAPITRSGARPGDRVLVTGALGGSLAGLLLLRLHGSESPTSPDALAALARHRAPEPRLREASLLASRFPLSAMIDISDGLSSEVHHLASASKVGIRIDLTRIPVAPSAAKLAGTFGFSAMQLALESGEEYELLFTAPAAEADAIGQALADETGTPATIIGEVTADSRVVSRDARGHEAPLAAGGWRHFRGDRSIPGDSRDREPPVNAPGSNAAP
jgi:thiamine-monophosphate kinase